MSAIVCPVDKKDDVIQRVSAVVSGGISSGNFSAPTTDTPGYTHMSGTATSKLAQMLDLPPSAKKKNGIIWWMYILLFYGCVFVFVGLVTLDFQHIEEIGTSIISFIVGAGLLYLVRRNKKSRESEYLKPQWVAYKNQWDSLYYCHRHGIVFDPETEQSCEPSQLENFVNKLIKHKTAKNES